MDYKSIEMLEFPQVREILAGFPSFSTSRELILNLKPTSNHERISLLLRQSAEARRLLSIRPEFSTGSLSDIRTIARLAARGKILEPQQLVEVEQTLDALRRLSSSLFRVSAECPLLWKIAQGIVELPHVERDISRCLTPDGELRDDASPNLAGLREKIKEARQNLLNRLEAIMHAPWWRHILQEPIITERDGRYVIPIKTDSRSRVKGIVHDVSNTGATVFIEPLTTVEMGNTLRELVIEERREVERILRDLSAQVGAYAAEISRSIALAAELDVALAKARYARKARATEPVIADLKKDRKATEATGTLRLVDARHPLLGDKAVPLSVEIGRDFSVLVITGPNTGGKTVALKTIGLLSLMTQAGIPIPAGAESIVPVFDGIFADIGDEQSIEQTLSSFSWHMGNIVRIIKRATDRSLVLLDELGTSTDPAEGSALAHAILLRFLSRCTLTVATTHFSELKAFAHDTPGLENASLDFDPVTFKPTYHLRVGIPGGSNALAIAAQLGLAPEIIDNAREQLGTGAREMETLLASVMEEKQNTESLRRELEKEKDEVAKRNDELKSELEQLQAERRRVIQETRDMIVSEAARLDREIRQAASELRREKSRERIEQARKAMAAVREQLKGDAWQTAGEEAETSNEGVLKVGDAVWLTEVNLEGTVTAVLEDTQQVEVQAGQAKFRLGLGGVQKMERAADEVTVRFTPVKRPAPKRPVSLQLDIRGKRAEEVEIMVDSYLNDVSLASLTEVRIMHGIGTGTLRRVVRDTLAAHPLVKAFRSGKTDEGGDGATIVSL